MSVTGQRLKVADPVVAGASRKIFSERQRRQSRESSGASATDDRSSLIHLADGSEIFCAVHAIVDINDSPFQMQAIAKFSSITSTTPVIDIKHCNATAG